MVEIAQLCKEYQIYHLVNNAYGLQLSKVTHLLNEGLRVGRVDAIVQSTDKNFMVPVGACIIAASSSIISAISSAYAGRASGQSMLDLLITYLSMGKQGYQTLLKVRKVVHGYFKEKLVTLAAKFGERALETPGNPISIGVTLATFDNPKQIGANLFHHCVSGMR